MLLHGMRMTVQYVTSKGKLDLVTDGGEVIYGVDPTTTVMLLKAARPKDEGVKGEAEKDDGLKEEAGEEDGVEGEAPTVVVQGVLLSPEHETTITPRRLRSASN